MNGSCGCCLSRLLECGELNAASTCARWEFCRLGLGLGSVGWSVGRSYPMQRLLSVCLSVCLFGMAFWWWLLGFFYSCFFLIVYSPFCYTGVLLLCIQLPTGPTRSTKCHCLHLIGILVSWCCSVLISVLGWDQDDEVSVFHMNGSYQWQTKMRTRVEGAEGISLSPLLVYSCIQRSSKSQEKYLDGRLFCDCRICRS